MAAFATRREFLGSTAAGLAALGGFEFLGRLPLVRAEDATPNLVQLNAHIETLVRLLETSSRDRVLEDLAARVRNGTSYREVLAALFLAAVRNVQPYPSVGFKFHAVLVVNSCHLASLSGPDSDRWLPIFWAADAFKSSQADEISRSGWSMKPVNESLVPDAAKARQMFTEAMDAWDLEKADAATAGLCRTAGATEVFNQFARYAARDFRAIGHKAIFLANAWRTLMVIGWEHAEPVMRSLAAAMLNHEGDPNPSTSDLGPDRPWRQNASLLPKLPTNWWNNPGKPEAAKDLIATFREASAHDAATAAAGMLEQGIGAQTIWDGVFVGAGELLMRQPGIVGLHGLTTANALHFIADNVDDDELRRRLVLQACSVNALFRDAAKGRGQLKDLSIASIEPVAPSGQGAEAIADIVSDISGDKARAAAKIESYLGSGGDPYAFVDATRRMIFLKGRDSHDYKFSSAVLEDFAHVSPEWRSKFLATSVFHLKGSGDRDNGLVQRTRAALG